MKQILLSTLFALLFICCSSANTHEEYTDSLDLAVIDSVEYQLMLLAWDMDRFAYSEQYDSVEVRVDSALKIYDQFDYWQHAIKCYRKSILYSQKKDYIAAIKQLQEITEDESPPLFVHVSILHLQGMMAQDNGDFLRRDSLIQTAIEDMESFLDQSSWDSFIKKASDAQNVIEHPLIVPWVTYYKYLA